MTLWTPPTPMPSFMAGMRADVFDNGEVFFEPGCFADAGGANIWTSSGIVQVNPAIVGVGGRDRLDPSGHGTDTIPDGMGLHFYLLGNQVDESIMATCSPAWDYGGPDYGGVVVPPGYTLLRKHPYMGTWRSQWGGLFPFHFAGIQNPKISVGLFETSAKYLIGGGSSPTPNMPVNLDLAPFLPVPGGVRLVTLQYEISGSAEGTACFGVESPSEVLGTFNPAMGGPLYGYVTSRIQSPIAAGQPNAGACYVVFSTNTTAIRVRFFLKDYTVTEVTT